MNTQMLLLAAELVSLGKWGVTERVCLSGPWPLALFLSFLGVSFPFLLVVLFLCLALCLRPEMLSSSWEY